MKIYSFLDVFYKNGANLVNQNGLPNKIWNIPTRFFRKKMPPSVYFAVFRFVFEKYGELSVWQKFIPTSLNLNIFISPQ